MHKLLSILTVASICSALVFVPCAFGAVEPWAYSVLAVLAYTALAAAVSSAVISGGLRRLLAPLLVPAVLAVALVWSQAVEWPEALLHHVSPRAAEMHQVAFATGGTGQVVFSPSLYPHATRDALVCLAAYVALFAATYGYVSSQRELAKIAAVIASVGFVVSVFGIVVHILLL